MQNIETWKINGCVVTYNDELHKYCVDGKEAISVTQLLKFKFPGKYSGIDETVLKKAAERGTLYHKHIEMYEQYGIGVTGIEEFRNYLFLKEKFNFEVIQNEVPILIKYKDLYVCGRLDLVLQENDQIGLGDLKFTATLDKEYLAYQLNLYKLGYEQSYGVTPEFLRGIHLKKSQRKYIELPINEESTFKLLDDYIKGTKSTKREKELNKIVDIVDSQLKEGFKTVVLINKDETIEIKNNEITIGEELKMDISGFIRKKDDWLYLKNELKELENGKYKSNLLI